MSRKTKITLVTVIVMLASIPLVISLLPNTTRLDAERESTREKSIDPELEPFQAEIAEIKTLAESDEKAANRRSQELLEKLPEHYQRYFKFGFEAGMLPVNFYGRIVDQHGEPIANTPVGYSLEGAFLAAGKGMGKLRTDQDGRFEIHGKGGALSLHGIDHPKARLLYPPPQRVNLNEMPENSSIRILGGQESVGGKNLLWTETSPENPHIFVAWRVVEYEAIEKGSMNGYMISDGREYTYDFSKKDKFGRHIDYPTEGSIDGHLRINCVRQAMQDHLDYQDWTVTITPIDGGIQPTNDYYLSLAPEQGYQATLRIEQNKNSKDYQFRQLNQRFYFTAKHGQVYGSLFVNINPHSKPEKCRFDIRQFKINPNGSRNLAVKN